MHFTGNFSELSYEQHLLFGILEEVHESICSKRKVLFHIVQE